MSMLKASADAADAFRFAKMVVKALVDVAQHEVAAFGALDFIEELELLQIERNQRVLARRRLVEGGARRAVEPRLVEAARHRIDESQTLKLLVRLFEAPLLPAELLLGLHEVGDVHHGRVRELVPVHVFVQEDALELHPLMGAVLDVQAGDAFVASRIGVERLHHMAGDDGKVLGIVGEVPVGPVVEQPLVLFFRIPDELVVVLVRPDQGEAVVQLVLAHAQVQHVGEQAVLGVRHLGVRGPFVDLRCHRHSSRG